MKNEVIAAFHALHHRLVREADAEGVGGMLGEAFALTGKGTTAGDPKLFRATLTIVHRLGLKVPLEFFVDYRGGKLSLDSDEVVGETLGFLKALAANAPAILDRKRAIRATTLKAIKRAAAQGVALELAQIEERPVVPGAEDWRNKVFFDVSLTMLSDQDGEPDTYTMHAEDAEEFANYLETKIIPQQAEIHRGARNVRAIGSAGVRLS